MSDDDDARDAHVGEIRRRFNWLEAEVARLAAELNKVREAHPTTAYLEARLQTVLTEISALRERIGALDTRIGGVSTKIDTIRTAWAGESTARKNAWLSAGLALMVTVLAAIILYGIGAIGGS